MVTFNTSHIWFDPIHCNHSERQEMLFPFYREGAEGQRRRLGDVSVVMHSVGGTSGSYCPKSADRMTQYCPETPESPEVEAPLLLKNAPQPSFNTAAVPSFWENQPSPFCSAAAEQLGPIHLLPNNPWKNYARKAPYRLLFSEGFGERGMIARDIAFPPRKLPCPLTSFC
ncbi:hypothetical protein TREES_T100014879 [Tupaia chinensis]|uniref:Uncharacterized protein n=1 Tax=Tupaia chinensis TaxID=246437 RepID=L9KT12_TUPCH|nr:hypothetical protein TREES_T100014879 [Tupaia chinensis]